MNISSGKTATKEKEVKIIWQQYTEELTEEILKSLILSRNEK